MSASRSEHSILLLRFDAPLMAFGGVVVDEHGVTEPFPSQSMLTGLLGNALGYDHRDVNRLGQLQERLRYAVRRDRAGQALTDFQTVDLGQDFLREAWTTRGAPVGRGGGSASRGTHIRYRQYWADAVFTVAMVLDSEDEAPRLFECAAALTEPERPLYLGRKPCIPSEPLVLGFVETPSLRAALAKAPLSKRAIMDDATFAAWWPESQESSGTKSVGRLIPITDQRDWSNQVHVGRRFVWEGRIERQEIQGVALHV